MRKLAVSILSAVAIAALFATAATLSVTGMRSAQAGQPSNDEAKNTVGQLDPETALVRLQKLGYADIRPLTRNGDYWVANATKAGKAVQVSVHVRTGAVTEKQASAQSR